MKTALLLLSAFLMACPLYAQSGTRTSSAKNETSSLELPAFNPTRVWTSSNGASTFKGKVTKYDGEKVTISPIGKNSITSSKDKFSEEDIAWLDENQELIGKPEAEVKALLRAKVKTKVGLALDALNVINDAKVKKSAKYYIILLSASWCAPCRAEAPHAVKAFDSDIANNPDIEMVLMSCDHTKEAALKWAGEEKMNYPIIFDRNKVNTIPGVEGNTGRTIPHGIIVDGDGNMITHGNGGAIIRDYKKYCK